MKPQFCSTPGCVRPGIFESGSGRVCGQCYGRPSLTREEAVALVAPRVPHGTSHRSAIIADAAALLLGESAYPAHPRAGIVRTQSLAILRAMQG